MHQVDFERYGFTSVEPKAKDIIIRVIAILLQFSVTNALYIAQACACKTIKASHLEAVQNILKYYLNREKMSKTKTQAGGAHDVMAAEFYGINSGSYFSEVGHTVVDGLPDLTRGGIDSTFTTQAGGATSGFVSASLVSKMIKEMKLDVRVTKEATQIIAAAVNATMDTIMRKARIAAKSSKELKAVFVERAAKQIRHVKAAL